MFKGVNVRFIFCILSVNYKSLTFCTLFIYLVNVTHPVRLLKGLSSNDSNIESEIESEHSFFMSNFRGPDIQFVVKKFFYV